MRFAEDQQRLGAIQRLLTKSSWTSRVGLEVTGSRAAAIFR